MLKKSFILTTLPLLLLLGSCQTQASSSGETSSPISSTTSDTTAPTITSFTASSNDVYTKEEVTLSLSASDDISTALTTEINVSPLEGFTFSDDMTTITFTEEGTFTVTATVTDEAGNSTTSDALTITTYDPYAHWTEEQEASMQENLGYVAPRSKLFADTTTVTQMTNMMGTVLGYILDDMESSEEGGATSEEIYAEYALLLAREGFVTNAYEDAYYAQSLAEGITTHSVMDLALEEANSYIRMENYISAEYGGLNIEFRAADYVMGSSWDASFVNGIIPEVVQSVVPAFTFATASEDNLIYLNDYASILSSMGMTGIQGKVYNATEDDIKNYLSALEELGYIDTSYEDLVAYETVMPTYMTADYEHMVMLQISPYLDASIPFYTLDIMAM